MFGLNASGLVLRSTVRKFPQVVVRPMYELSRYRWIRASPVFWMCRI